MVKTRMGLLDLRVQTSKVNASLRGARVVNVYDAHNGRTYILKLSVPPTRRDANSASASTDPSSSSASVSSSVSSSLPSTSPHHSSWEKRLLLIESGVRIHMTEFDREKDIPSGFCLKLRKHIRTRRLEAVRQLGDGGDRIIDLVFSGEGATCAHLIVEAFSGGNVILTDPNYTILTLLRAYKINSKSNNPTDDPTRVAVRERYPVENARMHSDIGLEQFLDAGRKALSSIPNGTTDVSRPTGKGARRKLYARGIARKALAVILSLEPTLLEHSLITAGFEADAQLSDVCANDCAGLRAVHDALVAVETQLKAEMKRGEMKGYIISKVSEDGKFKETYDEFSPYMFAHFQGKKITEFNSFDEAADEFFARLESERVEAGQAKREAAAFKKVDKLELELRGQVNAFESARDKSWQMAQAIENNFTDVEAAIMVIRSAIAAAVPWDGLAKMVQDEKRNGNPIAEIIHSLQLDKNQMTLMLEDAYGDDDDDADTVDDENDDDENDDDDEEDSDDDEDDDEDEGEDSNSHLRKQKRKAKKSKSDHKYLKSSAQSRSVLLVPVDINQSAHANARWHYETRKSAAAKLEKAAEVKDRTVKAASRKAVNEAQKLEQEAVAASIRARRKALWFEKFYWFVSSENYLVVAGRDAQQNELLVKRYLGPADLYVHADVDGASSVIVKNRTRGKKSTTADIPTMTLEQAGTFAMCRSSAWESKIVTSAWWVRASQVSKMTSLGQYLPPGNFAIRGKKNFLNPQQLVMALAFIFKVDEESAKRHKGERAIRGFESEEEEEEDGIIELKDDDGKQLTEGLCSDLENGQPTVSGNKESNIKVIYPDETLVTAPIPTVTGQLRASNEDKGETSSSYVSRISAKIQHVDLSSQDSTIGEMGTQSVTAKEDVDSQLGPKRPKQNGNRRLSSKERQMMKNAKNGKKANNNNNISVKKVEDEEGTAKPDPLPGTAKPKAGAPLPRGKKHKLKKMKKYMDQDDEERRIALAVLGSKPIKEELNKDISTVNDDGKATSTTTDINNNNDDNNSETVSTKRPATREPKQENLLMMDDEGIVELERLEAETTATLRTLTGIPTLDDVVEFALPMCAPLQAVAKYRYRTKLMPGNMKRGKAYRAAVVLFQRQAEKDMAMYKQERDAIRTTPESDGIHGMLGNVKIMAPGLADAQKALSKQSKKAAASTKKGKK